MLANVFSGAVRGVEADVIDVEVDIAEGLPSFTVVGLPETAVKESKERVKAAISNSGYRFPPDRITVNLAPAHLKKDGTGFDLPIALGILAATGLVPRKPLSQYLVLGELSLDGSVKAVSGTLAATIRALEHRFEGILVPYANHREAAVVRDIPVLPVRNLYQAVDFLRGDHPIQPARIDTGALFRKAATITDDFADVVGQAHVKRAMTIAAAGNHNILMTGPPGSGKTMLARRLPGILPPLSFEEAIETTKIFSVVGLLKSNQALITQRPFRAPHHTISDAGLIGGGRLPRPGETSLAHNGVLFLDELPEFRKSVLEVLRQPLEDRCVTIARAASTLTYPAAFMLVASMNPCPCGYLSDPKHECRCTPQQIQKYRHRISGPLMDRLDLHVDVPAVSYRELSGTAPIETSADIRKRVIAARVLQLKRFRRSRIFCNAHMNNRQIRTHCRVDADSSRLLEQAVDRLGLSARAYNRILKIARTISDLEGGGDIQSTHISEAIQYRSLDRTNS